MNNEEIIKRIYGKYYSDLERYIDEYGRIKFSRFDEFCRGDRLISNQLSKELRLYPVTDGGIEYVQPISLEDLKPEPIPQLTSDDESFLDTMAAKIVGYYFDKTLPVGFKDNVKIARLAYSQALAMLEVKHNGLQELIAEHKLNYKV